MLSQAYALPAQPVALAVTQTRHGITSRQVLGAHWRRRRVERGRRGCALTPVVHRAAMRCPIAGLATDQLYGINKKLLDPRRHSNTPTAEDAEEGLIKYAPALVIEPRHILSYNQTVRWRAPPSCPGG